MQQSGQTFEYKPEWGVDLQTEHERYLTEVAFEGTPVFVTDYPKEIKAFYMRLNDDGKTVVRGRPAGAWRRRAHVAVASVKNALLYWKTAFASWACAPKITAGI